VRYVYLVGRGIVLCEGNRPFPSAVLLGLHVMSARTGLPRNDVKDYAAATKSAGIAARVAASASGDPSSGSLAPRAARALASTWAAATASASATGVGAAGVATDTDADAGAGAGVGAARAPAAKRARTEDAADAAAAASSFVAGAGAGAAAGAGADDDGDF
jgi:hypothetical protein